MKFGDILRLNTTKCEQPSTRDTATVVEGVRTGLCVLTCVCVCVSSVKTVLAIMGILNLNEATAAIKRCRHGNDRERESEEGRQGRK